MPDIPIIVLTNQKHHWLIPGYCYLHREYWGTPAEIISYGSRPKEVPPDFNYRMIDRENYPSDKWSTGIIRFLQSIDDPLLTIMLEDYWISEPVKLDAIEQLEEFMEAQLAEGIKILRMDLSADRKSKKQCRLYVQLGGKKGLQIVKSPSHTPYQMSLQAAIWNRELLLEVLLNIEEEHGNKSAQHVEVFGTPILKNRDDLLVLGTTLVPVVYKPTYRSHKNAFDFSHLHPTVQGEMRAKGLLDRS